MGTWTWPQPGNQIWKVVSDHQKGKICIYDEKGSLLMEQTGLSKNDLAMIENDFLDIVANKENNRENKNNNQIYI